MSDQESTEEMSAVKPDKGEGDASSTSSAGGGEAQESQPSPLALLAATCSRIESPNENSNSSQGQQGGSGELDLNAAAAQLTQSANGWQIISAGSSTPTGSKEPGSNGSNGSEASKSRPVSTGPYVVTSASGLQNQQVLTGLPGVIPNIQYQVIPQFQTIDGQQLQFATTPAQVNVQQDASGQLQIIPGSNQQIITSRAGGSNLIAMPNLLQQAVPIQGVGLANNSLSGQTQYVANVPVALNGNITLLPVNSVAASLAPTSQTGTLSSSGSPDSSSQPATSGAASSSGSTATSQASSGAFFTNANSYSTTTTTSNVGVMNFSTSATVGTNVQAQTTPQRASSVPSSDSLQSPVSGVALQPGQQKEGDQSQQSQQQQQQILIQPQLVQGGQTIQALQTTPLSGQTFATQAISQDTLQNLQLQAVPNSGPIIIRTPTVGPNGQVSWQTIQLQNLQVQNPQAQTITLAPMQGVSLGQTGSTSTTLTPIASLPSGTVTVNAAQLSSVPGLQTINLSALGASGIQVHQLQGLPLAIANAPAQPFQSLIGGEEFPASGGGSSAGASWPCRQPRGRDAGSGAVTRGHLTRKARAGFRVVFGEPPARWDGPGGSWDEMARMNGQLWPGQHLAPIQCRIWLQAGGVFFWPCPSDVAKGPFVPPSPSPGGAELPPDPRPSGSELSDGNLREGFVPNTSQTPEWIPSLHVCWNFLLQARSWEGFLEQEKLLCFRGEADGK
ncbi:PREDICTED: transcription factor Sp1 isoform X3 [Sturnus vulgaris]|uniref:transcription factor Sp1 isoform X3 n=1 Tax=Sturnus vulgaris TaxID=9172 RepID=UPI00071A3B47|nr:PREDICTED: transcription factor Sp1 isoform X3 [Sturnus vulgaris]